jgi:hypothetical protein
LFKPTKTTNQALANNLTSLLDQYGLRRKIIVYVKNERSNLNAMIITLKSSMKCEVFGLDGSFQRTCFCHVFFLKHANMLQLVKKYLEIEICFNQIYIVKFAQMHNLAKKSRKKKKNGTRLVKILIFSQDN